MTPVPRFRYDITLALHLLLNAPEPELDAIWAEVSRITDDSRIAISSDLCNPHNVVAGSVNVHGTRYFAGRSANFVMEHGARERNPLEDYLSEYGWEVRSGLWHADGTTYNGMPGYIEWTRLD